RRLALVLPGKHLGAVVAEKPAHLGTLVVGHQRRGVDLAQRRAEPAQLQLGRLHSSAATLNAPPSRTSFTLLPSPTASSAVSPFQRISEPSAARARSSRSLARGSA